MFATNSIWICGKWNPSQKHKKLGRCFISIGISSGRCHTKMKSIHQLSDFLKEQNGKANWTQAMRACLQRKAKKTKNKMGMNGARGASGERCLQRWEILSETTFLISQTALSSESPIWLWTDVSLACWTWYILHKNSIPVPVFKEKSDVITRGGRHALKPPFSDKCRR